MKISSNIASNVLIKSFVICLLFSLLIPQSLNHIYLIGIQTEIQSSQHLDEIETLEEDIEIINNRNPFVCFNSLSDYYKKSHIFSNGQLTGLEIPTPPPE